MLGGWRLQASSGAVVTTLTTPTGRPLGWAVQAITQVTPEGNQSALEGFTLDVLADPSEADLHRALYGRIDGGPSDGTGLVGAWTAILIGEDDRASRPRVYVAAGHSVVFSRAERCVATTHNLVPNAERDEALARAMDPLSTGRFYAFGLTAASGVERLLPNHVLDLTTFEARRHHPLEGDVVPVEEAEAAERFARQTGRMLRGAAERFDRFHHSLSAGHDSRAVLALARPAIEGGWVQANAATSVGRDVGSQIDGDIAAKLAARAGIPHEVKRRVPTSEDPDGVMRAFLRIGEAAGGRVLGGAAAAEAAGKTGNPRQLHLPGMGGETARVFYWQGRVPTQDDVTPAALVRRVGMPLLPEVVERATAWLEGLPASVRAVPADLLDLLYVEQRLGCWEAPTRYLYPGDGRHTLNLMTEPAFLDACLRLPVETRLAGTFQQAIVRAAWPVGPALQQGRRLAAGHVDPATAGRPRAAREGSGAERVARACRAAGGAPGGLSVATVAMGEVPARERGV